jgi:hypothetical protein
MTWAMASGRHAIQIKATQISILATSAANRGVSHFAFGVQQRGLLSVVGVSQFAADVTAMP